MKVKKLKKEVVQNGLLSNKIEYLVTVKKGKYKVNNLGLLYIIEIPTAYDDCKVKLYDSTYGIEICIREKM